MGCLSGVVEVTSVPAAVGRDLAQRWTPSERLKIYVRPEKTNSTYTSVSILCHKCSSQSIFLNTYLEQVTYSASVTNFQTFEIQI